MSVDSGLWPVVYVPSAVRSDCPGYCPATPGPAAGWGVRFTLIANMFSTRGREIKTAKCKDLAEGPGALSALNKIAWELIIIV